MLLKFQRKNTLESESSSTDSDYNQHDTMNLLENKSQIIRLMMIVRLRKMIYTYKDSNLEKIDKQLIKGLFYRHIKDFDELEKEKFANRSLLQRLKLQMLGKDADNFPMP